MAHSVEATLQPVCNYPETIYIIKKSLCLYVVNNVYYEKDHRSDSKKR